MKNKGILYIILSSLFFSIMAVSVKALPNIPVMEKLFFRNIIGLIAVSITLIRTGQKPIAHNKKLIGLRSLFGVLGVYFYYSSLSNLNLADGVIINKLSPFFVILLSVLFLKEDIKRSQMVAVVLAIVGAAFVIKPTFNYEMLPGLIGLSGALCAGAAYTVIRKLSETDQAKVIVFYFCLASTLVSLPSILSDQFVMPQGIQWLYVLILGFSALGGQMFMTTAYKYKKASELSIYTYMNIVFSIIWSILIWSEFPDALSLLGAGLIITGGFINFRGGKNDAVHRRSIKNN